MNKDPVIHTDLPPATGNEPSHLITAKGFLAPLEGCRGLLALCVVGFHFCKLFFDAVWTPWGYLAVDFFFILSGFVITRQYEAKIAMRQIDLKTFALRRLARLYPLYLVSIGLAIWLNEHMIAWNSPLRILSYGMGPHFVAWLIAELTMTGNLTSMAQPNGPVWSVSAEWIVNLVFFALVWYGRRIPNKLLWTTVAIGAIYMISVTPHTLDDPAHGIPNVRGIVGFTLGWLIFRYHRRLPAKLPLFIWMVDIVIVALIALMLELYGSTSLIGVDYAFALFIFPAVIIVCLYRWSLIGQFFSLAPQRFLGRISYSIYLLHYPLTYLMVNTPWILAIGKPRLGVYYIFALLTVATLSYMFIEVPGRWLGRKLSR